LGLTNVGFHRLRLHAVQHVLDPWTARVHERTRMNLFRLAVIGHQRRAPDAVDTTRTGEPRAHTDARAERSSIDGVHDDEPRVVDARVGINEAAAKPGFEPGTP